MTIEELQQIVRLTAQINHSLQSFRGVEANTLKKQAMKQTKKALKALQNAIKDGITEGAMDEWPKEMKIAFVEETTCIHWAECERFEPEDMDEEGEVTT